MKKAIIMGRSTRIPEYKEGEHPYVKFTLASDNKGKDKGASFIPCVAFGKTAESIYKWVKQGTQILVWGEIETNSYTDRDGNKKNGWSVIVDTWEFAQSKGESTEVPQQNDGFASVPDSLTDDGLPFV